MILEAQHSSFGNGFGGLKVNDFEGWEFQNETCDQNDFGRSEVYILNGQKKDFEKWFSDTYSTSKIISQGWGDLSTIKTL